MIILLLLLLFWIIIIIYYNQCKLFNRCPNPQFPESFNICKKNNLCDDQKRWCNILNMCPDPDPGPDPGPDTQPDCVVSDWSEWSECSNVPCGVKPTKVRSRTIVTQGKNCPSLTESADCVVVPCQDCVVSDWSEWSECSQPCGGGIKNRSRTIITPPGPGGKSCPARNETSDCNSQPCNKYGTLCAYCKDGYQCTYEEIENNRKNCDPNTGICKNVQGVDQPGCLPTGMDLNDVCGPDKTPVFRGLYKEPQCQDSSGNITGINFDTYCVQKFNKDIGDPDKQVLGVKKPCFNSIYGDCRGYGSKRYSGFYENTRIPKFTYDLLYTWDCAYPGTTPCAPTNDCCSSKPGCGFDKTNIKML